ncbi:helix-turn-helix transcriptional regulator [Mucilaginibacter flavus]|uniref:helix-turn-helix transcriptional regulator n=1 Tax=Mucilaginibacter flavus TaxID=931504 RepID=UPI0025B47B8E|nr:helix-turn-helix transcriptional regulator [Mucilaginibacter flavus]MDN3585005.1 helix-turn-helix transcriptional regulator [Mucilaginibacter flavus]
MEATTEKPNRIHHGRNVKRFREMLGLKQDALAIELGEEWNQKRISLLEAKENIEPDVLAQVAKALKVPEEAIKNFDEEKAIYNIQNNYDNAANNINYNFNPIEKIVELYDEKVALLERLLASEKEKNELLKNK